MRYQTAQKQVKSISLGLISVALMSQLVACTTFSNLTGKSSSNNSSNSSGMNEVVGNSNDNANQVVGQVGQNDAVVSVHDRDYWLELRSNPKGSLAKAKGALATGEADAAADQARAFLAKNPGHVDAMIVLAAALTMSRKYELAAYYAGLVDKAQPGNPVALNIKGMVVMLSPKSRVGDYRRAAELFNTAFNSNDAQIAPGLNLGHLQLELGDANGALATFSTVQNRCHDCRPALLGVGVAANRLGKNDTALTAFKSVLDKNPNDNTALYHLALVYKNGYNNKKQAEKLLLQILADRSGKSNSDLYVKERAHVVMREIRGEADPAERTMIADDADEKRQAPAQQSPNSGDQSDAELMMSAAEMDE